MLIEKKQESYVGSKCFSGDFCNFKNWFGRFGRDFSPEKFSVQTKNTLCLLVKLCHHNMKQNWNKCYKYLNVLYWHENKYKTNFTGLCDLSSSTG